jgi:hypothetical protein
VYGICTHTEFTQRPRRPQRLLFDPLPTFCPMRFEEHKFHLIDRRIQPLQKGFLVRRLDEKDQEAGGSNSQVLLGHYPDHESVCP